MSATLCDACQTEHDRATQDCRIPAAPYYVLTTDSFLSNWQGVNRGLRNCPVVPCQTYEQVVAVMDYARARSDQKNVRYTMRKPRRRPGRVLNLVPGWLTRACWAFATSV